MKRNSPTGDRSRIHLWRSAAIAALALSTLLLVAPAVDAVPPEGLEPLLRALSIRPWWGDPPALSLAGVDGQHHALGEIRGKVVLLYFWATW